MTLGDADFRKFLMKMIYRKFAKTPSLPVTCHTKTVPPGKIGGFNVLLLLHKIYLQSQKDEILSHYKLQVAQENLHLRKKF